MSPKRHNILEALLFVAEGPLTLDQLAELTDTSEKRELVEDLRMLQRDYQQMQRSFELVEVGGGWQLRTRMEYAFWIKRFKRQQITRLSKAALETLAIVAYKQPVLKAEIERIRGVDSGAVLRLLMEKGLVRVAGRKDLPGRPLVYATTRRFLEVFDLKSLKDLPTLEEMEALAGAGEHWDPTPSLFPDPDKDALPPQRVRPSIGGHRRAVAPEPAEDSELELSFLDTDPDDEPEPGAA